MLKSAAMAFGLLAILLVAACGGGGSGEEDTRPRLTDPASVPTVALSADARVYQVGSDGTIFTEGAGTAAPSARIPSGSSGGAQYTVQPGDNCASIAASFDMSTAELRGANPLINEACSNLLPGQSLRIPGVAGGGEQQGNAGGGQQQPAPQPTEAPTQAGGTTYVLQPGDFCGSVAEAHGVSLSDFLQANGLTEDDCTRLDVGDVVIIP